MEQVGAIDRGSWRVGLPLLLALGAAVFWLHYFLVQRVFGLLNIDQIYFAQSAAPISRMRTPHVGLDSMREGPAAPR